MNIRTLITELGKFDPDATVILIDEDSGNFNHIDRVCKSEDPPADGSLEVWIVQANA